MINEDHQEMAHGRDVLNRLGTIEDVLGTTPAETSRLYGKYLNPVLANIIRFTGMNRRFVYASGAQLKDEDGRTYLDFLSGFGALNLGHEPQEILDALHLVEERPNILQSALNPFAAKLAEYLAAVTPGSLCRSFFCNSGTEAVEAALKLARCATGRSVLLSTDGAYHGKTFGALSVSGKDKYRKPFQPLVPQTERIPYDDLENLEKRLARGDVAGFIVEPIQGENGVIVPRQGYLKGAEELCRRHGTLLLVDEVQTGMGRTGRLFACGHEGVEPDVLILSKSLGGGLMPIGAIVTTDGLWKKAYGTLETALLHSSTFGGNTRACVCGIAALRSIIGNALPQNATRIGQMLLEGLRSLKNRFSVLQDVRGKGLMIGMSFARFKGNTTWIEGALTLWIVRRLAKKHRILTAFTINNLDVMRIAPPLMIGRDEVNYFLGAMEEVLASTEKFRFLQLIKTAQKT